MLGCESEHGEYISTPLTTHKRTDLRIWDVTQA